MREERASIYETVTQSIINELERGIAPWVKPWKSGPAMRPRSAISQRPYRGVNVLLLWSAAIERGYTNPAWLSYKQASDLNGHVKRGERGTRIVYVSTSKSTEPREDESEVQKDRYFLKSYAVFNIEQTAGLPEHLYVREAAIPIEEALFRVDAVISRIGADVRHGGNDACYHPRADFIMLPERARFKSTASYYATSLHEHAHWSGHATRLNRDLTGRFGTEAYAAEELVAELATAFTCSALAIRGELRHAAYIKSWLELLKHDSKAIFTAASAASKATDYLRQLGERDDDWVREYEETEVRNPPSRPTPGDRLQTKS